MMSEPKIPLSAVLRLLDNQNAFHTQLIDKLGLYLSQAASSYERALNPPLPEPSGHEMIYSAMTEEEEDLKFQVESGMIPQDQVPQALRRLFKDTEVSLDIT